MKTIEKECKTNGLTFEKCGKSKYRIQTAIDKKDYVWKCKTLKECREAIVQALSLRSWLSTSVG